MGDTLYLKVVRKYNKRDKHYCIGELYVQGTKFCDTMEPADWGLTSSMSVEQIKAVKAKHTEAPVAIPTGSYRVVLDVVSAKYSKSEFYRNLCGAKVPRLQGVKGYEGVLIHVGNIAGLYGQTDTLACLLVGYNRKQGMVLDSKATFTRLYNIMKQYKNIFIEYKNGTV